MVKICKNLDKSLKFRNCSVQILETSILVNIFENLVFIQNFENIEIVKFSEILSIFVIFFIILNLFKIVGFS